MRIALLINSFETEKDTYTTTRLALAAHKAGHDVVYLSVEDFICDPDETIWVRARSASGSYKSEKTLLAAVKGSDAVVERLKVQELDALLLRNDPADDTVERPWAQSAGMVFGLMAARRGVIVLNDPVGLAKAVNKIYFEQFPRTIRPRTLVTRHADEIHRFIDQYGGDVVLKPFQGSGGESVFVVRENDRANLNQIIDTVSRNGYIVAQEYLEKAAGEDIRMFLLNGKPLERDGVYAAFRRRGAGDDLRSNMSAGGSAETAVIGEIELEIAEMVRPQLLQDGMFMVGIDIAGDRLIEVNVFSPGGLGSVKALTGVDFAPDVIQAVERKVAARERYSQHFDNRTLATM
ncbi:glutathione synthase [soil metagenome]